MPLIEACVSPRVMPARSSIRRRFLPWVSNSRDHLTRSAWTRVPSCRQTPPTFWSSTRISLTGVSKTSTFPLRASRIFRKSGTPFSVPTCGWDSQACLAAHDSLTALVSATDSEDPRRSPSRVFHFEDAFDLNLVTRPQWTRKLDFHLSPVDPFLRKGAHKHFRNIGRVYQPVGNDSSQRSSLHVGFINMNWIPDPEDLLILSDSLQSHFPCHTRKDISNKPGLFFERG
jgi:hypothetical protein